VPKNSLSYPKVCKRKDGKYYVDFKLNNKRYRLFSCRLIGSSLYPNSYPAKKRYSATSTLAKQVYEFIVSNDYSLTKPLSTVEYYDSLIRDKLAEPLSNSYKKTLVDLSVILREELIKKDCISSAFIDSIPLKYDNNTSYNTTRRHVNVLVNFLHSKGFPIERSRLKSRKQQEVLHSPIKNVKQLLLKLKEFNQNLYLCCLLTYGCLLRPHQEIRLLKWEDFSDDLSHINLTGVGSSILCSSTDNFRCTSLYCIKHTLHRVKNMPAYPLTAFTVLDFHLGILHTTLMIHIYITFFNTDFVFLKQLFINK